MEDSDEEVVVLEVVKSGKRLKWEDSNVTLQGGLNIEECKTSSSSSSCSSGSRKSVSVTGLKKQMVKISNSIKNRPSRYFGSADLEEILSEGSGVISSCKSSGLKMKRLLKHSSKLQMRRRNKLGKNCFQQSVNFSRGKMIAKNSSANILSEEKLVETEMIGEGPHYYEAFSFIIKKVHDDVEYKHLFLERELQKMSQIDTTKSAFQLYVRLLNHKKCKWNRCSDIAYADIAGDLSPLFDYLEMHELISCDVYKERLDVLLQLLKKVELKAICNEFKVIKRGNKQDLVNALLHLYRSQFPLQRNGILQRFRAKLGRCIQLVSNWRQMFRRCIFLFSMFHSVEDLDGLLSEQAHLLLHLKLKNFSYPVQNVKMNHEIKIFGDRDQIIRFEEARELKQEVCTAIQMRDFKGILELSDKVLTQFRALLQLTLETKHVLGLPVFLQQFSAGSVYAIILTSAIDSLKQAQKYDFAVDVLDVLLRQNIYGIELKGEWAIKLVTLYHVNIRDIDKTFNALCNALGDKSLISADRMHLQQKAEKILKLKKSGLSLECKKILQRHLDLPMKPPKVIEISATAMSSSKRGFKKVYIKSIKSGKELMSVEETVIAHYKGLGFENAIHDEGSTVSSLCILSLWNHIYDTSVPSVFQSPYQIKPLDWASKDFYVNRRNAIDAHFALLKSKSVQFVANYLCDLYSKYCHTTCIVNWNVLQHLNFYVFLECLTVRAFVAISQRLMEDWTSHRKGFPDLVVWSPTQKKCFFIEVKSENDRLSTVQSMWLNFLEKNHADAFVVHVQSK